MIKKGTHVYIHDENIYGIVEEIIHDEDNEEIFVTFCINTPSRMRKFKKEDLTKFK